MKNEDKILESTGYRILFECVKENGEEPLIHLLEEINALGKERIITDALLYGIHDTLILTDSKEYNDTIKY